MGRPKGTKNKKAVAEIKEEIQAPVENEVIDPAEQVEAQIEAPTVNKGKSEGYILIKTSNREVVTKSNSLKFEVVHISGSGAVNNPKVFYIKILKTKLMPILTEEEVESVDDAEMSEITKLVADSKARGQKEYEASGARKKKLNGEIQPSEYYS